MVEFGIRDIHPLFIICIFNPFIYFVQLYTKLIDLYWSYFKKIYFIKMIFNNTVLAFIRIKYFYFKIILCCLIFIFVSKYQYTNACNKHV